MEELSKSDPTFKKPCAIVTHSIDEIRQDWNLGHFPKYTPDHQRCVAHNNENVHFTANQCNFYCSVCKVWLHPKCFELFHTVPSISHYSIPKK